MSIAHTPAVKKTMIRLRLKNSQFSKIEENSLPNSTLGLTDGSKIQEKLGFVCSTGKQTFSQRHLNSFSIFLAKL